MFRKSAENPLNENPPPGPSPDQAWKLLSLVNEWIRHSDSKAGVTLAFTGVLGTMLFNLTKSTTVHTCLLVSLIAAAVILLITAAAWCAWTLTPRVKDADAEPDSINRLFFGSIASHYKGTRQSYREALSGLTADPVELTKDLADQIHANAKIAAVKARSIKYAIQSALAAAAAVTAIAIIIGINNYA